MDISGLDVVVQQIFCQFLCHALGEGSDQHPFLPFAALQDFFHQVVNLVFGGTHLNLGVKQSCRTDDLLYNDALSLLQLIVGRGGTDVDDLMYHRSELVERQRTVVKSCRQPETIFNQIPLARAVSAIHSTDLWYRDMAFVDDQQKVLREEVQQTVRTLASLSAVEIARIVLNA